MGFAPRIKAFLIKSGSDHASAEEHAQEAMATVWRKAHMFDPSRASAATWMFTIARNKKIDAIRKQRRPEPEDKKIEEEGEEIRKERGRGKGKKMNRGRGGK